MILEALECNYIKDKGKYFSATRPGGDNRQSINVYKNSLIASCYTAGITNVDIIGLVVKLKNLYFTHAIKFICDCLSIDYYGLEKPKEKIELIKWLDDVENIKSNPRDEIIKPIPEIVLTYYINIFDASLYNEDIKKDIMKTFEIKYDLQTDSIVYPIRDELGSLVGIKARTTRKELESEYKYFALFPYPKTKILYGLHKSLDYINKEHFVYVVEAEKSVLKLFSYGYKNVVALSGKTPSEIQIEKLLKLNCPICWVWDNDVWKSEDKKNLRKIVDEIEIFTTQYLIYDQWNMLDEKDSPCDKGIDTWNFLEKNKLLIK